MTQNGRTLAAVSMAILLVGATLSARANACRCLEPSSAAAAYRRADAAVIGKVIAVEAGSAPADSEAVIEVAEAWKSKMLKTVRISTSTDCAFKFAKGKSYLLFLLRDASGSYSTERCMGNREVAKAGSFLIWLRRNGQAGRVADSTSGCQRD